MAAIILATHFDCWFCLCAADRRDQTVLLGGDRLTEAAGSFLQLFFSSIWSLFDIQVPGLTFSYGSMYLGLAVISISIYILRAIFGGGHGRGESYRAGSSRRPKVSEARRRDQY